MSGEEREKSWMTHEPAYPAMLAMIVALFAAGLFVAVRIPGVANASAGGYAALIGILVGLGLAVLEGLSLPALSALVLPIVTVVAFGLGRREAGLLGIPLVALALVGIGRVASSRRS